MSLLIDPKEVYDYLQELGYDNISTRQLQEFIKDLKKLIKHDERQGRGYQDKENVRPKSTNNPDVFETLYENHTKATKAKTAPPKKDKIITVKIKQHKDTCRHYKQKAEIQKEELSSETKISQTSSISKCSEQIQSGKDSDKISDKTALTKESDRVVEIPTSGCSRKSKREMQGFELKPKASFIRPKSCLKTTRSDPVSLYHRYQAEWKKQKIPGEENHSNLRWVIREKMLGEQQFQRTATVDMGKKKLTKSTYC